MSTISQFSTLKSLAYMMIGISGAVMAGSGQYMHDLSIKNARANCITRGESKASCEKKYKSPYTLMNTILMYAGCGFVVFGFFVVWILSSSMFARPAMGMGMGMGMGGMGMYGGF